jgi:hypothetical protein
MPTVRAALLVVLVSLVGAGRLAAQELSVTGKPPGLTFGVVLPGVPVTIEPSDARSGRFDITGPAFATIEITFSFPMALDGPDGASMPVSFGSMSAGYSVSGSIGSQVLFDPRVPIRFNLSEFGRGTGFVGGILSPSRTQAPGPYGASLSVTVAVIGL